MTASSSAIEVNNVSFESVYDTEGSFAQLIIDAYNAGIPIRSPGREFILENSSALTLSGSASMSSSSAVMSGFANSEILPDDIDNIMSLSAYTDSVINQVEYLPVGYIVTFMTPSMLVNGVEVSNLTYQQITLGVWSLIDSLEFNTQMPTESYNEYNDGSNNPE